MRQVVLQREAVGAVLVHHQLVHRGADRVGLGDLVIHRRRLTRATDTSHLAEAVRAPRHVVDDGAVGHGVRQTVVLVVAANTRHRLLFYVDRLADFPCNRHIINNNYIQ